MFKINEKDLELLKKNYNQLHNISRLFNVLPNFRFTSSEMVVNNYW